MIITIIRGCLIFVGGENYCRCRSGPAPGTQITSRKYHEKSGCTCIPKLVIAEAIAHSSSDKTFDGVAMRPHNLTSVAFIASAPNEKCVLEYFWFCTGASIFYFVKGFRLPIGPLPKDGASEVADLLDLKKN